MWQQTENNTSMKSSAQIVWVPGGEHAKCSLKHPEKKQELGVTQAGFKDLLLCVVAGDAVVKGCKLYVCLNINQTTAPAFY